MSSTWQCPLCHFCAARNLKGVVRHIGAVHSYEANFQVTCGVSGCPRIYKNFHSYKKHLFQKHRDLMEVCDTGCSGGEVNGSELEEQALEPTGECVGEDISEPTYFLDSKKQAALFLMKATAVSKVSSTALDNIIGDIHSLLEDRVQLIKDDLAAILHRRQFDFDPELVSIFQNPRLIRPFQDLQTDFMRRNYYTQEMRLLEPTERKLGERVLETGNSHQHTSNEIDYVYEIPLLASIQQLLSDPFILDEVLRGHQRQDQNLADFCDGSAFKSHPLFSRDYKSLQIVMYYDDVEVCNPLGSRAKKHKLALFYYTLGNISPMYRSTMRSIQLLAIMKSSVLQRYGADIILENVVKDIKQLEQDDGVTFNVGGVDYVFNGTLSLIPGDNLASQYLGGFKGLSSALRKCRQCMAIDDDMQSKFVSEAFQPRTKQNHTTQCRSLHGPLLEHYKTTFGISRDSILNSSRYFHVTEGLIPDVMHDILEGALPLEMKELLKYFIGIKQFSLLQLNEAMKGFPYGGMDSCNKPTPVTSATLASHDHLLKQTATQMWCFARLLPLMIGERIEERNPHWENFLILLLIMDYCFAPVVCEDWAAYLRVLIDDHHTEFKKLYPSVRLTPKMHYMVHLPDIMCKYGPLVRFWCMRFEGKHNYFKDLAHRVKCFKNIPKTMAYRHQELVCYYINSSGTGSPYCKENNVGPVSYANVETLDYKETLLLTLPQIENDDLKRVSWFEVNGTRYRKGNTVVLEMDLVPQFGIIMDIVVVDVDLYYLVCEVLVTDCFSHHFHSYKAHKCHPPNYDCVLYSQLYDHSILASYTLNTDPNVYFIPLKYQLIENV